MDKNAVDEALLGYIAGLLREVADEALPTIREQQVEKAAADPEDRTKADIVAMVDDEIARRQVRV